MHQTVKKPAALSLIAVCPWVSPFVSLGLCSFLIYLISLCESQPVSAHKGMNLATSYPVSRIREPAPVPMDG